MPLEADTSLMVPLEPQELASVVEALHDAILRRLSWSVLEEHKEWRKLAVEDVKIIMDSMVSAYSKGMMLFGGCEFTKDDRYQSTFSLPSEVWDLLYSITAAESWLEIPFHDVHNGDCEVCKKFNR